MLLCIFQDCLPIAEQVADPSQLIDANARAWPPTSFNITFSMNNPHDLCLPEIPPVNLFYKCLTADHFDFL